MIEFKQRTMIVPAAFQQLSQGLCSAAAGPAGEGLFTTALSPTGLAPATHYISAGYIEQQFADILPLTTVTPVDQEGEAPSVSTCPGNVAVVEGLAAQAGIPLLAGTIAALFAAIDVSEQEPFTALARLGLQITQTQEAL